METNRNSMKLDIEAVRLSAAAEENLPKETYKVLPEGTEQTNGFEKNGHAETLKNMVRETIDNVEDGADEKMLNAGASGDKEKLAAQKDEVKFITHDQLNGDAKIDIGAVETFTAMTKEELMKFANDPFWVRLRWVLFIFFWALWVAMLVGAILIIIDAPKCPAPEPLTWWQQGPFVVVDKADLSPSEISEIKDTGARAVVFSLPPDDTYFLETKEEIRQNIKKLVDHFNPKDINVVLDIVPNFMPRNHPLFVAALSNEDKRTPFVMVKSSVEPTNWQRTDSQGKAWVGNVLADHQILSQFGTDRFDLQFSDPVAKELLKNTIRGYIDLGVKGIRLANAEHLIIGKLENEEANKQSSNIQTEYEYYLHTKTTYHENLAPLLLELKDVVLNATDNNGFLSLSHAINRPEALLIKNELPYDLPQYGTFTTLLANSSSANKIQSELVRALTYFPSKPFLSWSIDGDVKFNGITSSEYNLFLMALSGVPIAPIEIYQMKNKSTAFDYNALIEKLRTSPSYMHGDLNTHVNGSVIAYSRIKSGNPGYFVVLNPSDSDLNASFETVPLMPAELTVVGWSTNYNHTVTPQSKIPSNKIPISKHSVIMFTYVPKKE